MTTILRPARPNDLEAIMVIENASFLRDAWSSEAMLRDLVNPQCHYLVAERNGFPGEIAAYAGLFAPQGAHEADIQTIAVAANARRAGLGRTLMLALIDEAGARGAAELFLDVRVDKPGARALYESLGFVQVGIRAGYYQPDNVDAVLMRLVIVSARARAVVGS